MRTVGRVKDAHGLKGEIWVVLFAGSADWLDSLRADGRFWLSAIESPPAVQAAVPSAISASAPAKGQSVASGTEFSLKGVRVHKNGLILQSPAISDRTAAEKLKGQFLVIPEAYLEADDGDVPFLTELDGFRVFEKSGSQIGAIVAFGSNGIQDLLVVELVAGVRPGAEPGSRIEIPFVDVYVVSTDYENRKMTVDLPGNLIEVQLGLDRVGDDESSFDGDQQDK